MSQICPFGFPTGKDALQKLYVAMSRARDYLIVVGTRDELKVLGEQLVSFNQVN